MMMSSVSLYYRHIVHVTCSKMSIISNHKPVPSDPVLYQEIKDMVKASVSRWPSAYASGMLVKIYKAEMAKRGKEPYLNGHPKDTDTGISRWFREKWIDILTGKPCGKVKSGTYYPTCRPSIQITNKTPVTSRELTQSQIASMILQKQKAKGTRVLYKETHNVRKASK